MGMRPQNCLHTGVSRCSSLGSSQGSRSRHLELAASMPNEISSPDSPRQPSVSTPSLIDKRRPNEYRRLTGSHCSTIHHGHHHLVEATSGAHASRLLSSPGNIMKPLSRSLPLFRPDSLKFSLAIPDRTPSQHYRGPQYR